jgi:hypothetical protein
MKQFQTLTRSQPQTFRFVGLDSSQFAQETIDKYSHDRASDIQRFSLIFWKPQDQLSWKIIQNQINLNPYFYFKSSSIERNQHQISNYVKNELFSKVLSPNFTNIIYQQVLQWFSSKFQKKISQSFVHSELDRNHFKTFSSTLAKIDRDFSITLTVNSRRVNQEHRSLQSVANSAMTFSINNHIRDKQTELQTSSKTEYNILSVVAEPRNFPQLLQRKDRFKQPIVDSTTLTKSNYLFFTQINANELLLISHKQYHQNIPLTHRHPLSIQSIDSIALNNNPDRENRTLPFVELVAQQPSMSRISPPSLENPSLALPYYRVSMPMTQELAKVKTQLATLQADTEQLSLQSIAAAQAIPTPLPIAEVNRLTEQVYQSIERKIKIEQERRGR